MGWGWGITGDGPFRPKAWLFQTAGFPCQHPLSGLGTHGGLARPDPPQENAWARGEPAGIRTRTARPALAALRLRGAPASGAHTPPPPPRHRGLRARSLPGPASPAKRILTRSSGWSTRVETTPPLSPAARFSSCTCRRRDRTGGGAAAGASTAHAGP